MPAAAAPGKRHELTPRAVITAVFVASLIGASYPYIVLKIGYGPNISVVSAFLGFIILTAVGFIPGVRRGTRWENNMVQTAGTAAGQAGFMCVVLAAFDMLNARPELHFSVHLTALQTFAWLSVAGMIGVLLAVPLRKHYIDEEDLLFADGTAAGEAMMVLDADPRQARQRVLIFGTGTLASGFLALLRDQFKLVKDAFHIGPHGEALRFGAEISLLSFGSGMLVGARIAISMGIGMVLSWVILPGQLVSRGIVPDETFKSVLRWVMWPATGLMVAGGLTALILKWKVVARTFSNMTMGKTEGSDFPMRLVVIGVPVLTVILCLIRWYSLHFPIWLTLVSLGLSFLLMLVGTRVLGETNWAPISALANLMQAVFAVLSPHNMAVNMIGSGMSGTIAANGEHLMQDYKAGKIVGSNNRNLTILQLVGVPVGSLAVALVYPALKSKYGIGDQGLSSPISVKWAGFAELLNQGFHALPAGCFHAMLIAVVVGVILTCLEPRYRKFVPSPTAMGIGMLVPGVSVGPMVLGGIAQWIWSKAHAQSEDKYNLPLSSGLILGDAVVALIISIILIVKTMSAG